jgi:hypothetical protein
MMTAGIAESLYTKMESQRYPYLTRARDAARLTLPTLMVDEGHNGASPLPTPYQSVGARGVNNLASALLLSLLPPNSPFFRLVIDQSALNEIESESGGSNLKTEMEEALSKIERSVLAEIETQALRVHVFEALRHLIVTGNVLLHLPEGGGMRAIHLDRFVVKRGPMGEVIKVVVKECLSPESLPPEAQVLVSQTVDIGSKESVDLYTCVKTVAGEKIQVFQEIGGQVVPGSEGLFKKNQSPYIVLRMNRSEGEDYGRGYVEQYLGDLTSLESLMQSVVEASAAAAKVLFLVAPNGVTRARSIAEAPNGAIVEGSANDVSVLQLNKAADLSIAYQTIQTVSDRLSYAFLLTDNAIRNAERVTAAEVRLVTQSIERQLGGIYSVLSQEFQLPLVQRLMDQMTRDKRLPKLPSELIRPAIITGIEALGRGNDLNKMDEFLAGVGQLLGPEALGEYVDFREYMDRRAMALGIDTEGLIKSEEEIQQQQQQRQLMAAAQQFGPQMIESYSKQQAEAPQA